MKMASLLLLFLILKIICFVKVWEIWTLESDRMEKIKITQKSIATIQVLLSFQET